MSYEKLNFISGQILKAEHLNHMEDGILEASGLPEVTTSDAGKFLRVSSTGEWVAETISNAAEATF